MLQSTSAKGHLQPSLARCGDTHAHAHPCGVRHFPTHRLKTHRPFDSFLRAYSALLQLGSYFKTKENDQRSWASTISCLRQVSVTENQV